MAQVLPSNNHAGPIAAPQPNPYAAIQQPGHDIPAYPKPVAQLPSQHTSHIIATVLQPTIRHESRYGAADSVSAYKSDSLSTNADSFTITPLNSEEEKRSLARDSRSHHTSRPKRSSRDPEKAAHGGERSSRDRTHRSSHPYSHYLADDEPDDAQTQQERQAVKILMFLSFPCVVLSFLNAIWALLSLFITLLTQPVRICARRPNFGQQLGGLLGPALNLQLKSIYTPLPPYADEDLSYYPVTLVTVQLLSPFLSLGVMLAAWVVAVFWFASAVVGDPAGMDKRDDGRETVLALRGWWEKWLSKCLRTT